jgi:hypothetical protein
MKTKQSLSLLFNTILFCALIIQIGCKKDQSESEPLYEKAVWAVGAADSTNYGLILFSLDGGDNRVRQGLGNQALA